MKSMTCKQLGGACDEVFSAETFEEIGEMSKTHAMAMFEKDDEADLKAAEAMKALMEKPGGFEEWYESKRREFEALPED